ncbi:MAG: hypothetical protein IJN88_03615 [Clostridia bacterium]|nr:hypothetical protein [Clostridia bacterium]
MTQKFYAFYKKILAFIMSVLLSLGITFGDGGEKDFDRPEANSISEYSLEYSDYALSVDAANEVHDISDMLFGIFFEDINFAADGGLYAEKVVNRSFEYGELAADDELHGWSGVGEVKYYIETANALNKNNPHYAVIENDGTALAGIANKGFLEGMAIEKEEYDLSLYARGDADITVRLTAGTETAGEAVITGLTDEWAKYEVSFDSSLSAHENVFLQVLIGEGSVEVDMISLFPAQTYKGHGMRKDLGEKLDALNPSFLRFPGGCVIEGWDKESMYDWKASLGVDKATDLPLEFNGKYGDVAARSYGTNLWTNLSLTEDTLPCYMSYGLGFFEYFQLAEDLGAVGVPVINCGLYCQMRGKGPVQMYEADGKTYTAEFAQYLDDMHDLIEFCRGDVSSDWGKVRASLGHAEPFELKYICIGNEQEGQVYFDRYVAFLDYFNEKKAENPELYEGLELIYSSGADDATSGANYLASYEFAKDYVTENAITDIKDFAGATDHHYYNTPDWFLSNTDHYDKDNYSRDIAAMTDSHYGGAIKVFVGEYAAQSNRLEAALAEAAYMTGLERNGDIVEMAAYAPLFGNLTATHWAPDLIWFNNHLSTGSINYYVQKLFGNNAGDTLISSELKGADIKDEDLKGKVGLGTWWTAAEFDNVKVTDTETGRTLASDCFTLPTNFWWDWKQVTPGDWHIRKGKLTQENSWHAYNELGASAFFGKEDWSNYTYTFEATKTDGGEGFYIPFLIEDEQNMFFWNIGGWENTKSALQRMTNGAKTNAIPGTVTDFTVETGKTYEIKLVINGINIKGYIDGELQFDYTADNGTKADAYQVVSEDEETGDLIIKLVNVTEKDRVFAIDIANLGAVNGKATVSQVAGDSLDNDNILGAEEDCIMEEFTLEGIGDKFNYTAPMYSVTAIRIHR